MKISFPVPIPYSPIPSQTILYLARSCGKLNALLLRLTANGALRQRHASHDFEAIASVGRSF